MSSNQTDFKCFQSKKITTSLARDGKNGELVVFTSADKNKKLRPVDLSLLPSIPTYEQKELGG